MSYHTVAMPSSSTDQVVADETAVDAGTYYIRKEVGGCADVVSVTIAGDATAPTAIGLTCGAARS